MHTDLDSLLTALYVLVDDLLPERSGAGRRPKISDAELITLAVAQILLQCHSERRFLRLAHRRLCHLFPYIPKQPGYYQTTKSQLSLESHGGHIPEGVWARIRQRVLALAASVWHSWQLWERGRPRHPDATSPTTTTESVQTESVI